MLWTVFGILCLSSTVEAFANIRPEDGDYRHLYPKACIAIGIKNHNHSLSYIMGAIESLRYPRDRIHLQFSAIDKEESGANKAAQQWSEDMSKLYLSTSVKDYSDNWLETSLQWARQKLCEYILLTDTDMFLTENLLIDLIKLNLTAVSPLMTEPFGRHSNVESLLDSNFVERKSIGLTQVYYVNLPIFINLKNMDSSYLTFDSDNVRDFHGASDPIQVFAHSAYTMQISLFVSNQHLYGYFIDSSYYSIGQHQRLMGYFLADLISVKGLMQFPLSAVLEPWNPLPTTLGFDKVYIINLKRRPERLEKMSRILKLLGLKYEIFEAVDGKLLTSQNITSLKFLPHYKDPFTKRAMTMGEIGCFLSHYEIWKEVINQKLDRVLVFEDDARFAVNSTLHLNEVIEDMMKTQLEWDLIYLGRKKINVDADERFVPGHRYLSTVTYSYWTLGYAISQNGAKKLLNANPLENLLPLDEFLPIMYNEHPNNQWSKHFLTRNLKAFALYPVIVTPERYTHEEGYISDTETSAVISNINDTQKDIIHPIGQSSSVHPAATLALKEL